ncbi:restriction endonuclease subunit S [Streptococcus suis]
MSEWKLKSLKDLSVSITSGLTPLKNNSEYWDNPVIPWLKTDQLGEKYIWDTNTKISEIALEKTSLKLYPPKTLSIAMYGEGKTRGNISIIMKPMATNQACCNIIINDEKADFEYVYYYMKTQYESLRGLSSGVRNNLNANDIKNYEIRIPESIVEQNNISKVLSVLDQKIAINNQINEELEAMAKTLYDYWFVQFDFPDENGKPYKSSGGKMVYNDQLKREIPEGWGVKCLGEISICHDSRRVPLSSKDRENKNGIIPYYGATGIMDYIDDFIFEGDYILMAEDGSVMTSEGKPILQRITGKTWVNNHAHVLEPTNEYSCKLLLLSLKDISVLQIKTGSIQMKITKENMNKILLPDIGRVLLSKINEVLLPIDEKQLKLLKQNQELTQLRDWLLPMLMNGQVKVE